MAACIFSEIKLLREIGSTVSLALQGGIRDADKRRRQIIRMRKREAERGG